MQYQHSIEVFGTGEDPKNRSHWGFVIHQPPRTFGDLEKLWYEFEPRFGTDLDIMQALAYYTLISLEVEDLVPTGTSQFWKGIIELPAKEVQRAVGGNWSFMQR
ncbi:hypothetical protein N7520_010471 [Penicillium odoratum]|uniref:uncharacterized protein n=1 Tax=Penicillium odoratum TaxID=1167516 RepID=UPI0025476D95|nr:uncharacterized protein N7520_010471 [Penicillium odoratum]KAJ5745289.1 hypothetical protein N7520_010471 [Penicillium odoratum]